MKRYCLGFLFNDSKTEVRLVLKTHPEWQKGKWNGIGGHIEEDETSFSAMMREGKEEAGVTTEWKYAGLMVYSDWECFVYTASIPYQVMRGENDVGEKMEWWTVDRLPKNKIGNTAFLIPYCLHILETTAALEITYVDDPKETEVRLTL